jgi:hypothetical protein
MRSAVALAIVIMCAAPLVAAEQTWTGAVSDAMCGADHSKMGTKLPAHECTLTCAKKGVAYALVADGKVFRLTGHESDLGSHAGEHVSVTGELKGDTIRVAKVAAAAAAQ